MHREIVLTFAGACTKYYMYKHYIQILHVRVSVGGGGGTTMVGSWLSYTFHKKQRATCHETKPMTPEIKFAGQRLNSEIRWMTRKTSKCCFAVTVFLSKLEQRFKDQNVLYVLQNTFWHNVRCFVNSDGGWAPKARSRSQTIDGNPTWFMYLC